MTREELTRRMQAMVEAAQDGSVPVDAVEPVALALDELFRENASLRAENERLRASAPAPVESRADEDRIEVYDGAAFIHSERCDGACDYGCASEWVCLACGGMWNGQPARHCDPFAAVARRFRAVVGDKSSASLTVWRDGHWRVQWPGGSRERAAPVESAPGAEVCLLCLRTRDDHGSPPHEFMSNQMPAPVEGPCHLVDEDAQTIPLDALCGVRVSESDGSEWGPAHTTNHRLATCVECLRFALNMARGRAAALRAGLDALAAPASPPAEPGTCPECGGCGFRVTDFGTDSRDCDRCGGTGRRDTQHNEE